MTESDLDRNPVEVLAEEFLGRYRRGDSPSVTAFAAEHPGLANEILEVFPALLAVEEAGTLRPSAPRAAFSRGPGRLPERLGEFLIVREIGRGGWAWCTRPSRSRSAAAWP